MRTKSYWIILGSLLATLAASPAAFAEREGNNGGDMCERRFKIIRDDLDTWLRQGGSDGLSLAAVKGLTLTQYNTGMLEQIAKAQVSCTDDKVMVGNAEKTCKNFVAADRTPQVVCNVKRFMLETSESDQYVLVHHEYAGLAGFEVNTGEESHYVLSSQITGYLADQVVKKLVVKPRADKPVDPAVYGEWQYQIKVPSQNSGDVWTFTARLSLQPGKIVLRGSCSIGGISSGTAIVAIPATFTATQIQAEYASEQRVGFRKWGFLGGDTLICTSSLDTTPVSYELSGKWLILNHGILKAHRVRKSKLAQYPFSQPKPRLPTFFAM